MLFNIKSKWISLLWNNRYRIESNNINANETILEFNHILNFPLWQLQVLRHMKYV